MNCLNVKGFTKTEFDELFSVSAGERTRHNWLNFQ